MITALSDKQARIRGIEAGADDFLTRPVERAELLARVGSLLKLKHRTDELERAEAVLFTLARSIEGKDPYTHGHCERLSDYSARLGEHLSPSVRMKLRPSAGQAWFMTSERLPCLMRFC